MKRKIILVMFVTLMAPLSLIAAPRSVTAQKTEISPIIDGRVDEKQWSQAPAASEFSQQWPAEGAPASEKTEVRFIYTTDTLYIGIICFDSEPNQIVSTQSQRDGDLNNSDSISIILDTYYDRQNGFIFATTPAGIQYDAQILNEGVSGGGARANTGGIGRSATSTAQRGNVSAFNLNWDTTWTVQSKQTDRGWEAEMAIPLKSIRFRDNNESQRWGMNIMRNIRRKNEQVFWSEIPKSHNIYRVSLAGDLDSVNVKAARNLKFIPYALAGAKKNFTVSDTDLRHDVGFDVKYGINSAITLDITVNTDFAQVEVDDQQVNLTRFPLFFPEKRDFFLENAGIFSFGTPREVDLFFSRRIGLESGVEIPIRAGARLSGKIDKFQLGLLSIQTGEEDGVVPSTNFFVGRVRRAFHRRSSIGFIFTNREAIGSVTGKSEYNRSWGTDLQLGLGENWIISSYLARTHSPDLPKGRDWAGNFSAGYQSSLWRMLTTYTEVQDNFNPELGFIQRKGYRRPQFRIFFTPSPESGPVKRWNPHWSIRRYYGFDGELETERMHNDVEVFLRNGGSLSMVWNRDFELLRTPFSIHPGVVIPAGKYSFSQYEITAASDPSARIFGDIAIGFGELYDGDLRSYDFIVGFRAGAKFVAELDYVNTAVDAAWGRFNTNLGRLRINYSFTPYHFIQTLIQYNSRGQMFSSNIRLGLTTRSGTGLYVVYNDNYTTPGERFDPLGRSLFIKYSHQFDF